MSRANPKCSALSARKKASHTKWNAGGGAPAAVAAAACASRHVRSSPTVAASFASSAKLRRPAGPT